jgi:cytochrome c biogenesis protein CcmG, thiol:disulfide interchange protein DsbE
MRGLLSFALVALLVAAAPVSGAFAGIKQGDRAAEFVQVVDASGKAMSLKRFKDQVVVVTFGASWCEPCKKELPAYEKLAQKYQKRGAAVVFIAVNIDTESAKAKKFMSQARLRAVRAAYDRQKSTVESYDPPKMPSTFVIKRGIVKHVHAGYQSGDENKLAAIIDRELGTGS